MRVQFEPYIDNTYIKNFIKCPVILIIGLLFSCNSHEYNIYGSIQGEVRGQKAGGIIINPPPFIAGANVTLLLDGKVLQSHTTKSEGKFEFSNLDAGTYSISIQKEGYLTKDVSVTAVSGEMNYTSIVLSWINE